MSATKDRKPRKPGRPGKHWSDMTAAELAEATKGFEDVRFEDTRPLTAAERADWERAKRGRGRPPKEVKAARVLITLEPELLSLADKFARRNGMSRSQLIAKGLHLAMAGAGGA